jgi:hypothetical protein
MIEKKDIKYLTDKNHLNSFKLLISEFSSSVISRASDSASLNVLILFSSSAIASSDGSNPGYFGGERIIIRVNASPLRT